MCSGCAIHDQVEMAAQPFRERVVQIVQQRSPFEIAAIHRGRFLRAEQAKEFIRIEGGEKLVLETAIDLLRRRGDSEILQGAAEPGG